MRLECDNSKRILFIRTHDSNTRGRFKCHPGIVACKFFSSRKRKLLVGLFAWECWLLLLADRNSYWDSIQISLMIWFILLWKTIASKMSIDNISFGRSNFILWHKRSVNLWWPSQRDHTARSFDWIGFFDECYLYLVKVNHWSALICDR